MKLAIISTTIYGEKGYLLYDRLAKKSKFDKISFFIAGDKKSPPFDTSAFTCDIEYLTPKAQGRFASSEAIGWNKPARRNIALLRAMETNPDFILTIDDDNIPSENYFDQWHKVITTPAKKHVIGVKDIEHAHWHNYLKATDSEIELYTRGFPIPFRYKDSTKVVKAPHSISPEKIGVFQGISLGDPDIDAKTRIVYPKQTPLSVVHEKNYVLQHIWSPYNSQNTMFAKKLFPLVFMWSTAGRSEDIYASYVWQKFLFNNNMYAHIGDAVNFQERGKRNDLRDLTLEIETYLKSHEVWEEINKIEEKDPLEFIGALIRSEHEIIVRERAFMHAFHNDLERILFKPVALRERHNELHPQVSSRGRRAVPSRATLSNQKSR
ncbi:MAG: hypothetical protein AAB350_02225 [Patescibacteria group bacterium]